MNAAQRKIKQIKIVSVILIFIGVAVYFAIPPKDYNCFDGIQNYNETGIDCGGEHCPPCPPLYPPLYVKDLEVEWVKAIPDGDNNYDLTAKIINPNPNWGMGSVDYYFNVYGADGDLIGSESGTTYIMPDISEAVIYTGATEKINDDLYNSTKTVKYVIKDDFKSAVEPSKTTLKLNNLIWKEIEDLKKPNLYITEKKYGRAADPNIFYEASGVTNNKSPYSFNLMEIKIVLYDNFDEPVASGKTNQWTVGSGGGWIFNFHWNYPINENISYADYQIETNVFDEENYIKEF